jgi:rubrerythrin
VIEKDSALRELADDPSSRKRFLKVMGGTAGASALGIFLAACGSDSKTTSTSAAAPKKSGGGKGDLAILNYALTLEYLEAQFYKDVIDAGVIKDKKIGAVATKFGETEQEHVDALTATIKKLGGTPVSAPAASFKSVIDGGPKMVLTTAATVENLGAAAYLGQAGRIKSPEVLAAALSIHSVEARHAAALNTVLGKKITPDGAFAKPADMKTVLKAVKPFLTS